MISMNDFVIVGGGLSGLVLAARLTDDPAVTVTVLEAGNDYTTDPRIRTPALWLSVLGTPDFDWGYQSTPQVRNGHRSLRVFLTILTQAILERIERQSHSVVPRQTVGRLKCY